MKDRATVYIISDGTGETASTMVQAALVQYRDYDINLVRCKNVRTEAQMDSVIDQAFAQQAIVVYTMVSPSLRIRLREAAASKGLRSVDLLGPLLSELDSYLGVQSPHGEAGLLRTVDERYFKRIEAIEYTVKHDDGKSLTELDSADIILVGISRTSKTPLSIFLSHKGWKVANIPLVLGSLLPEELFKVDQRKVVGLIIGMDHLHRIRQKRLEKFGQDTQGEYASVSQIAKEIEYAMEIFKKNRRWPVFDVTERALEETASEITRIVSARMGLPDSVMF
jgi:regulator of PEP synthase PpsR (kinase-PPPase family)